MSTDTPLEQRMLETANDTLQHFAYLDGIPTEYYKMYVERIAALLTKEVKAARLDEHQRGGHDTSCTLGQWISVLRITSGCTCSYEQRLRDLEANK